MSIEGVNVPLGTLVALSEAAGNVGGGVGGGDPNELANPSEITTLGSPPDFVTILPNAVDLAIC